MKITNIILVLFVAAFLESTNAWAASPIFTATGRDGFTRVVITDGTNHTCSIIGGDLSRLADAKGPEIDGIDYAITEIAPYAFRGARYWTTTADREVTAIRSYDIKVIREYAFAGTQTPTIDLQDSQIRNIDNHAFLYARTKKILLPETLKFIGDSAFFLDTSRSTIINLPSSIEGMGKHAIHIHADFLVTSINKIYYYASNPREFPADCIAFTGQYANTRPVKGTILYVPTEAVEKCKTIQPWCQFEKILPISAGAEDIVADEAEQDVPAEYFNLNGQRMNVDSHRQLAPGLYIVRQGDKTSKIVIQ